MASGVSFSDFYYYDGDYSCLIMVGSYVAGSIHDNSAHNGCFYIRSWHTGEVECASKASAKRTARKLFKGITPLSGQNLQS